MFKLQGLSKIIITMCLGMILTIMCSCNINNGGNTPIATSRGSITTVAPLKSDSKFDIYINEKYGFSIKYPVSWDISEESPSGDGVVLYNKQGNDVRFYGGYLLGDNTDRMEINEAINSGFPVEEFATSNGEKGYKIVEKSADRVKLQIIVYGQNLRCNLYADISSAFYKENELLLLDMAKSILLFQFDF